MEEISQNKYAGLEKWVMKANDIFTISLVSDPKKLEEGEFQPEFTHQIFGDEEVIFGYTKVSIQLLFTSGSLKSCLTIKTSGKYKGGEETPTDIEEKLREWLPVDYTTKLDKFCEWVVQDREAFRPVGEKIFEYPHKVDDNRKFVIYKGNMETRGLLEFHKHFETFSILEIDASRLLDNDPRWELFHLYEKITEAGVTVYNAVGYVTVYPFYVYPDNLRPRISQFLILKPYQKQGHGSKLYESIFEHYLLDKKVIDITVEDPAEIFQKMRRVCDVKYLLKNNLLDEPALSLLGNRDKLEELHRKSKINMRQLPICIEIIALKTIKKDEIKKLRLRIKERLFKEDEGIEALEKQARYQELDRQYSEITDSYRSLIQSL